MNRKEFMEQFLNLGENKDVFIRTDKIRGFVCANPGKANARTQIFVEGVQSVIVVDKSMDEILASLPES